MKQKVRLILDSARSAAANMAVDEALMESQRLPGAAPTLRLYRWSAPSLSVGYFQNVEKSARRFGAQEKNAAIVRRLTGGGLVFHDRDVTFSLATKNPSPFLPADVKASYLWVNQALLAGLRDLHDGLDFAPCRDVPAGTPTGRGSGERVCFENPSCYDLLLGKKKIVGASQRRADGAILHQSTIFLEDENLLVTEKIITGFKRQWGMEFEELPLSQTELERAALIERVRYHGEGKTPSEWSWNPA